MNEDAQSTARVPDSWPGGFGIYKYSKQAVKVNLWTLVFVSLLGFVADLILLILLKRQLGNLVGFVVGSLITAATSIVFLAGVRGQALTVEQALKQALPLWLKMFLLNILVFFAVLASFLALIVPFFFVFPRLLLANYFLVDKKMDPVDAFKASWHATKGQGSKVWGIIGTNFAICLLFITIIGIPFAAYFLIMYSAAFPVLYVFLNKHHPAQPAATPVAAN